jgi:hypothetical protein
MLLDFQAAGKIQPLWDLTDLSFDFHLIESSDHCSDANSKNQRDIKLPLSFVFAAMEAKGLDWLTSYLPPRLGSSDLIGVQNFDSERAFLPSKNPKQAATPLSFLFR